MSFIENPAVPKGSIAVITGANGYIASHIADQFIRYGHKVRGTVRNPKKSAWLVPHFEKKYGVGKFELHVVPDMQVDGAYDEAIKGASIFVHTATVIDFNGDPAEVIGGAVKCGMVAIEAAYKEPNMKRFILTSSASTLMPLKKENFFALKGQTVDVDTFGHDAKELAWAPPPWGVEHGGAIYGASKMEQEQTIWKFYEENKSNRPDIVVNSIVPDFNFGRSIDPSQTGGSSSFGLIVELFEGKTLPELWHLPHFFIDVEDDAALHVAAALLPDVEGERIFAFAYPMNWDIILDILRKQNPGRKFADNFHNDEYPVTVKPIARAESLLKRLGRPGWISLEQSIATNTEHLKTLDIA
ncbi:NAD dependent epimerase/dehydratase [Colletotrichum abscissum]|uniref:NAD dependent epimerase/dehydratase n=1 Tax=Colletotrichum abscissum TaxID=1671311 RepID=A0A9P9XSI2_9PEZI|nr:NAD dependent epimerase/dehydratase [Colletotrichum abscissum]KAI3559687.1 NAD dependent epimerase/dehydratase [Colletotrichum abscissum]KAK1486191.1 NAD dependent epimerase/dehydratase [Colletotrichum abscissum]